MLKADVPWILLRLEPTDCMSIANCIFNSTNNNAAIRMSMYVESSLCYYYVCFAHIFSVLWEFATSYAVLPLRSLHILVGKVNQMNHGVSFLGAKYSHEVLDVF
jgi:hypothetical protein